MLGFSLPTTVLISRPKNDAEVLRRALLAQNKDAHVIVAPVIEITSVPFKAHKDHFDAYILTSKHGVPAAVKFAVALCVGDATAEAATQAGLQAISARGTSRELVTLAQQSGFSKLLYLRGEHIHGDLEKDLNLAGLDVESSIVYRQEACAFSPEVQYELAQLKMICVPVYSARSARIISQNLRSFEGEIIVVAISKVAASGWSGSNPDRIILAQAPNSEAMMAAIASQMS
jgi:uroporphyrinogen-III synthase